MHIYTYYPWRRDRLPTSVFSCPENLKHGQRSLVGYSPWDYKELDTTELLSAHTHTYICNIPKKSLHAPYPIIIPPFPQRNSYPVTILTSLHLKNHFITQTYISR